MFISDARRPMKNREPVPVGLPQLASLRRALARLIQEQIHDGEDNDTYVVAEDDNGYKLVLKEC